jgi:hypothetical protein
LFTGWLDEINSKLKSKILMGVSAICWTIWLIWNDIIFDKAATPSYLQVIFRRTYWTRSWSLLQKEEDCQMMKMGHRNIETTTIEVFARHDWRFSNRIAL